MEAIRQFVTQVGPPVIVLGSFLYLGCMALHYLERIAKALERRNELAEQESAAWDTINPGSCLDMLCRSIETGIAYQGRQ